MDKIQEKFTDIYLAQTWKNGESVSGSGSDSSQTRRLVEQLIRFIDKEGITSIIDCPCGDINWQDPIIQRVASYIGMDIVEDLIQSVTEKYQAHPFPSTSMSFQVGNLVTAKLPEADLLIVRDCFVHLKIEMIQAAIRNISQSPIRFVAMTTFPSQGIFPDATPDEWASSMWWRPLNMSEHPFNLPDPDFLLIEGCTEGGGIYRDKALAIWEVARLQSP